MNILLISPTSGGIGGIAQHVDGLSQFLVGIGHEVDIISSANTFTIPIKRLKNPSFMFSSFLKTKFKKDKDIVLINQPFIENFYDRINYNTL